MVYLDANIVLRYLLQDNIELYNQAKNIILNKEKVFLLNEVVAEIVYVLSKTYNVEKNKIIDILNIFISSEKVIVNSKPVLIKALEIYKNNNIDFVDSILCSINKIFHYKVMSFDRKLLKLIDNVE